MTKFEVGKTYKSSRYGDLITITRRTEKTVWFVDGNFSSRVKIDGNVEYTCPNIGIITPYYRADKRGAMKSVKINDNWEIKNNYVQNLKGHGFKIVFKYYDDEVCHYFEDFYRVPNYIIKKVERILNKYNSYNILKGGANEKELKCYSR